MTEDEAREKWCPFVRMMRFGKIDAHGPFNLAEIHHTNEQVTSHHMGNCIASRCVAWRWNEPIARNKHRGTFHSADLAEKYPGEYELLPASGYCGLAGKP